MSLDFLKDIKVDEPVAKRSGGGSRKAWNPTEGLAIRVWKDGGVFPSETLIDLFDLEYQPKAAVHQGKGLDVFPSAQATFFKAPKPLILINVVDKDKPRIDLFGQVGYVTEPQEGEPELEEGVNVGDPTTTVFDQGAKTFGAKSLLPMIKEVYDVEPNEQGYIDLVVLGQDGTDAAQPFALPEGKTFCHLPKQISRGEAAGTPIYVKREYPRLYILYPATLLEEGGKEPQ